MTIAPEDVAIASLSHHLQPAAMLEAAVLLDDHSRQYAPDTARYV